MTVVNDHNRLSDSERLQKAEQNVKSSCQRKTGKKQGHAAPSQPREPPSNSEPVQWSPQQQNIIDRVSRDIDSVVRWRDTGCKLSERPKGVTLLIFGALGVGKQKRSRSLQECAKKPPCLSSALLPPGLQQAL